MSQHVCGVRVMQVARVTSLGGRNWPYVVFLDMLSCPLSFGVTHDILWWFDCCQWSFDPPLLVSLWTCNVHNCSLYFLLFNFSFRSINFLFRFFFIYKYFYSFQFSPSIAISHMFGFSFRSSSFKISNFVLDTFVEVYFLLISSFNQNFCWFIFFPVWPLFFWLFFLLLKLLFNSIKPSNLKFLSLYLMFFLTFIFLDYFV